MNDLSLAGNSRPAEGWRPCCGLALTVLGALLLHSPAASALGASSGQEALSPGHRVSVQPLDLSRAPSVDELTAAGQLGGPLFPTHELKDRQRDEAARLAFGAAMQEWNAHEYPKAVGMLRQYLKDYPDSPWAAEAELHIGCDATYNGRYTEADTLFNRIIQKHQGEDHLGAKMLVNKARQRLALLRVEQNNLEEARLHFATLLQDSPDWRHRTYASHWIQRLSRYAGARESLANCGAEALAYAMEAQGNHSGAQRVRTNFPATMSGHSLGALVRLAAAEGMELTAVQVSAADLPELPKPALLRINSGNSADKGHYWVLARVQGDEVELYDPQAQRRFHQTRAELGQEWSRQALVLANGKKVPGRRLSAVEMEEASGGCCGIPRAEDCLGCNHNSMGSQNSCRGCGEGAPAWSVGMINLNLFVTDTPMWYDPPIGPPVRLQLSYNSQSAIAQYEPFGNKWQFGYASYLLVDTAGTVTVFMPDGRRDTFTPDGSGGYTRPYQVYNTLSRIAANNFELRFPDDTVYAYRIPAGTSSQQPFLVEIRDAHGQKLTLAYNSNVQLKTITDAQGRVTQLNYNASGLVTSAADPFGRQAHFEYDAAQNLTRITDMGGYWSSLSYDGAMNLTELGNERGTWTFDIEPADGIGMYPDNYPPPGQPMYANYRLTVTDPLGAKEEFFYYGGCDFQGYNGCSGYSWHVASRDYVPWTSGYANNYRSATPKTRYIPILIGASRQGEISQIIRPEGDYIQYLYDYATGDRVQTIDAHGHRWTWTYNSMGQVTSRTDPNGHTVTGAYAGNGVDLLTVSDALGQMTLTWDTQHDLLSYTDRLGNQSSLACNTFGQLVAVTNAAGVREEYHYDASQRLSSILRGGQTVASLTYDATNRIRSYTDSTGLTRVYDYNNLDEVTRIGYPDGKSLNYVYSSCCPQLLDSVTDRGGRTTTLVHDALKRLTQVVNAQGEAESAEYDANGNLTRLLDARGIATAFAYDLDNRPLRETFPDGTTRSFEYDVAGLRSKFTNGRGVVKQYAYDNNHNVTGMTYSDGTPGVTNGFDVADRLISVNDGAGLRTFSYDADSQLITANGPWASSAITYSYDAVGRRTSVAAQFGQTVQYSFDALDRLTQVRTDEGGYSYGYAGVSPLVQSLTRPNGSYTSFQYDNANRLTALANNNSSQQLINQFGYAYNAQDFCGSETTSNATGVAFATNQLTRYNFSGLNQLTNCAPPTQAFAYDADGNLVSGFTPAGWLFTAAYDAENRLTTLWYTNAVGAVISNAFRYTANGVLAERRSYSNGVAGVVTRFVRDNLLELQERDAGNNVTREYAWGLDAVGGGIGGLLSLKQGGQSYAYVYDGRGNVRALLQSDQSVASAYGYGPFGEPLSAAGTLAQPFGFATKRFDPEAGWSYFGYRYYLPGYGRWLTRDPLGQFAGPNEYTFAANNAINYMDPKGDFVWFVYPAAVLVGAAIGAAYEIVSGYIDARDVAEKAAVSTSRSVCNKLAKAPKQAGKEYEKVHKIQKDVTPEEQNYSGKLRQFYNSPGSSLAGE